MSEGADYLRKIRQRRRVPVRDLGLIGEHDVRNRRPLHTERPLQFLFFSSRRRHTRWNCDWSSDVCSSDLVLRTVHPQLPRTAAFWLMAVIFGLLLFSASAPKIGRASCRKECRSRWSPY